MLKLAFALRHANGAIEPTAYMDGYQFIASLVSSSAWPLKQNPNTVDRLLSIVEHEQIDDPERRSWLRERRESERASWAEFSWVGTAAGQLYH